MARPPVPAELRPPVPTREPGTFYFVASDYGAAFGAEPQRRRRFVEDASWEEVFQHIAAGVPDGAAEVTVTVFRVPRLVPDPARLAALPSE